MSIFNETELAKALESLYNDPDALAGQFKMPFKYKKMTLMLIKKSKMVKLNQKVKINQ